MRMLLQRQHINHPYASHSLIRTRFTQYALSYPRK